MKHIKTFESFLNEAVGKHDYHALWNKHIMQIIKDLDLPTSYKVIDWPDLPKKYQEEVIKYIDKTPKLHESFLNEGFKSLDYWKDYEVDNSPQAAMTKWMADKCTDMSSVLKCIDKSIDAWNEEAENEGGDRVSKPSESHIGDLAIQFYKKFGYINGNIISAMIMQES
jgi:hypothetical protein